MTLADGKWPNKSPVSPTEMSGFPVGLMPWDSPNGLQKEQDRKTLCLHCSPRLLILSLFSQTQITSSPANNATSPIVR